jgi:hypothetical protein
MKNNSYKEVDYVGNIFYYLDPPSLEEDIFHREDGPAVELSSGLKEWWILGKRHREDGPAVEFRHGEKEWWLNGKLHRVDGPALEYSNGDTEWWFNGNRHRLDGPALEYGDSRKEWWFNGQRLYCTNQEEFLRSVNLKSLW